MIKNVVIFDCDGVLLCSMHRYRTMPCNTRIDLDHWRANSTPQMIAKDSPLPTADFYKKCLANPNTYVIIATARECQQADFDVINFKLGKPDHIIYRKVGDSQSGVTLKLKGLRKLLNLKQFRNAAVTMFEDNLTYLNGVGDAIGAKKVYIESQQGH